MSDDRPRGPAETIHGFILGVTDGGSRAPGGAHQLRVTRQRVRITDHGTGTGPVVASLCLSSADDHAVVDDDETTALDEIVIDLMTTDDADRVRVETSLRAAPVDWPRDAVADRLLGILTRNRLDGDAIRPRLHGGALTDAAGRAVLVLGVSGAGKSTLTAHLAHAGLGLVSDEQVTIYREHELVAGFTRPVAVKGGGMPYLPSAVAEVVAETGHTVLVTAERLGTRHQLTGRPALVVLPERSTRADRNAALADPADPADRGDDVEAAPATWELLSPEAAVEALVANNLDLATRPVAALEAFAWLASTCPVVRLRYEDSGVGATAALALLADPPATPTVVWTVTDHGAVAPASEGPEGPASAQAGATPHRVSSEVISVHIGAQTLLYHRSHLGLALLNPAGADRWRALVDGGIGEDASADVGDEQFLDELVAHGYVVRADALGGTAGAPDASPAPVSSPDADADANGVRPVLPVVLDMPYRRRERLISRRIRGRIMVTDPNGAFHTLDGSAALVWDRLDKARPVADLIALIAADLSDDPAGHPVDLTLVADEVGNAMRALLASEMIDAG